MTQFVFSSLANGQHLSFNPDLDTLLFDTPGATAAAVRLTDSAASLGLGLAGKQVWLDAIRMGQLSLGTGANLLFANGSLLGIGDASPHLLPDFYGQAYGLQGTTVGHQVWGLGGADSVTTGSAADWLVGNPALSALNHVSRAGTLGAPTAATRPSISADGNLVAFEGGWSAFGSLNDNATDVIVKNMTSGAFSDEHENSLGTPGNSGSGRPLIAADGTLLAFLSASSNLVAGPASQALYDIYVAQVSGNAITRVSTGTGGSLAADGRSENPDLSADGRYVVFESTTSNWAPGGATATRDIFLKDRSSGSLTRLSTSLGGGDGNGDSLNAKISADGRFVVFESAASNLTTGDTNGLTDIFVWDRERTTGNPLTNLSALTDTVSTRNPANSSNRPDIAFDGAYGGILVFETAKALLAADTSNATDIYAFDLYNGTLQLVSATAGGTGVQLGSEEASISGDGRFVVFTSFSDQLVAGDSNGTRDIFVKDLQSGQIALVSRSAAGGAANGPSLHPQISLGGDWIVFESSASNLAASDGNGGFGDVFRVSNPLLRDTLAGGAGNDSYVLERADLITEAFNAGIDTVRARFSYTLGANLENLLLTGSGNITGKGNGLNNVITGNPGNNLIDGLGGTDTASYAAATAGVTVSLALTTAQNTGAGRDTLLHIENLLGSSHADTLTGNSLANRLDGGPGNDTLKGGGGNDTYVTDSSADVIVESGTVSTEIDSVIATVNWVLGATLENLTLGGAANLNGSGNAAANTLVGNAGINTLSGGGGNDLLSGGAGADTLYGENGNDRLDGGPGNDTLNGGGGNDTYVTDSSADVIVESGTVSTEIDSVIATVNWVLGTTLENLTLGGGANLNGSGNSSANTLVGNAGANILSGGSGNDTLSGGAGNDTLAGGSGADRLSGGAGSDSFQFNSTLGFDTLGDFTSGSDKLRLSQSQLRVGDGDLLLEGATLRAAPGGFAAAAELVIFTANLASLGTSNAAAAIGSANSAYAVGQHALFALDNGVSSNLYWFTSGAADALVSAPELTLIGTLSGTAATVVADYLLVA